MAPAHCGVLTVVPSYAGDPGGFSVQRNGCMPSCVPGLSGAPSSGLGWLWQRTETLAVRRQNEPVPGRTD